MRIAVLADSRSSCPKGELANALLEELQSVGEPSLFGAEECGDYRKSIRPREFERVVALVHNAPELAFVARELRRVGGIVVLHEWTLDRLATGLRPALVRGGFPGRIAAWREGGISQMLQWSRSGPEGLPLNRSVVRFGDAFVVPDEQMRKQVLEERNAPTPTATLALDDPLFAARRIAELIDRLPCHRTARRSLVQVAIEEADRKRAERSSSPTSEES